MATTRQIPGLKETIKTVVIAGFIGVGIGHWGIPTHDLAPIQTTAAQVTPAATPLPH